MRCATCHTDNPPKATQCEKCGTALQRRRKRGADETDSPFGPLGDGPNRRALIAYRVAVVGLIPIVGGLAGPLALALWAAAWVRDVKKDGFTAGGPLYAALLLGVLDTVANAIGMTLMLLGLW